MKQSQRLESKYSQLRAQLIAEILLLHKQHTDIEIEPEVDVFYANGYDEQDEPQTIQQVEITEVVVFHQGNEQERVKYEHLVTETLIALLKAMEKSLDGAKEFKKFIEED